MGINKAKQYRLKKALEPFYELMDRMEEAGETKQRHLKPYESEVFKDKGAPYLCHICKLSYFDKQNPVFECRHKRQKEVLVCNRCFEKIVRDRMARIELGLSLPKRDKKTC